MVQPTKKEQYSGVHASKKIMIFRDFSSILPQLLW
jgi:hypothetical protein